MESNDIIKIRSLTKRFTSKEGEVTALKNVDLTIREGEIFGIIGLSGAGKSTLVRCINFLERPTEGTVFINGLDLSSLSEAQLRLTRRSIGMIFQQFNLLMQVNALENICFPLKLAGVKKCDAEKRARELLELVGLADKEKAYPAQLSGGQKQRVAIARALANSPRVLLCDEATSALDPTTTRSILALLKEINQKLGITIVVITHEMSVVEEICTSVAIIDSSTIVETGKVEDVFKAPKTDAARRLLFPNEKRGKATSFSKDMLRIVFDGNAAHEPIIANMVLSCHDAVNILFANTKTIEDKIFGQMLIELPNDESKAIEMKKYLLGCNVHFEEVNENA